MTQYREQDMARPIDSRKEKIKEYLQENDIMFYIYDMGDNWVHVIFVEQIIVPAPHIPYPVCIGGAKKCPPEDCGGLSGYYEMIAVLKKGKGEFYQEYLQWLGSSYERDPF